VRSTSAVPGSIRRQAGRPASPWLGSNVVSTAIQVTTALLVLAPSPLRVGLSQMPVSCGREVAWPLQQQQQERTGWDTAKPGLAAAGGAGHNNNAGPHDAAPMAARTVLRSTWRSDRPEAACLSLKGRSRETGRWQRKAA